MEGALGDLRGIMESKWLWGAYLAFAVLIPIIYTLWFRFTGRSGPEQALPERLREMALVFRGRAFRLRLWSSVFLYASILVLFSGLYFVVYVAKELVENDSPYLVRLQDRQAEAHQQRAALEKNAIELRKGLEADLSTAGGGKAWYVPFSLAPNSELQRVHFVNKRIGWIAGYKPGWHPLLLQSDDGGNNWREAELPEDLEKGSLHDIQFLPSEGKDTGRGWAVGHDGAGPGLGTPLILTTEDGGGTWQRQAVPASVEEGRLTRIEMQGGDTGWAVGLQWIDTSEDEKGRRIELVPLLLKTENGGQDWTVEDLPLDVTRGFLADIEAHDDKTSWAIGEDRTPRKDLANETDQAPDQTLPPKRSLILVSSPNGTTPWVKGKLPPIPGSSWLKGVYFIDAKTGFAVGEEYKAPDRWPLILLTTDGGQTWQKPGAEFTDQVDLRGGNLNDVVFRDEKKGWAVGKGAGNKPLVLTTDDGGATWERQALPATARPGSLLDVFFLDGETGWSVGYDDTSKDPLLFATRAFDLPFSDDAKAADLLTYLDSDEAPRHIAARFRNDAASLVEKIKATDSRIRDREEFMDKVKTPAPGTIQYGPLLTRVAALVLIFLLVNLMIRLYQYNTRLAAFYDARADALVLSKDHEAAVRDMSLVDMINGLSPESHDYAAMPKSPMDQVTEVAKAVAAKAR